MKRITRFKVSVFDKFGDVSFTYKWTRGTELMAFVWEKVSVFSDIAIDEWFDMVQSCRENGNVLMDFEDRSFIEVKRWSYHRK